jgi:hypothetical protein
MSKTTDAKLAKSQRQPLPDGSGHWFDLAAVTRRWPELSLNGRGVWSGAPHLCSELLKTTKGNWVLVSWTTYAYSRMNESYRILSDADAAQWLATSNYGPDGQPLPMKPVPTDAGAPLCSEVAWTGAV